MVGNECILNIKGSILCYFINVIEGNFIRKLYFVENFFCFICLFEDRKVKG